MNTHLAYFLTAVVESIILYIVLYYLEQSSRDINKDHITMIIITNFISVYAGFYLLPWFSSL